VPAELVPLAKACSDDPSLVEVFELEINGQEIDPGYSQLNDPIELRKRFEAKLTELVRTTRARSTRISLSLWSMACLPLVAWEREWTGVS